MPFTLGPVPDLLQKFTGSSGTSDLCISLKGRRVLCFVSKASGQARGLGPGTSATEDASRLQGTKTRPGDTRGFDLSVQNSPGGWVQDCKFQVGARRQLWPLAAVRPQTEGENGPWADPWPWGPGPHLLLCG